MDHLLFIAAAVGLSLDSFAASMSCGSRSHKDGIGMALRIAIIFGVIQASFYVIGWIAGSALSTLISGIDHWIAFSLLLIVGTKMILESIKARNEGKECATPTFAELIMLGVATSIDSLIVGGSYALLHVPIMVPAGYVLLMTMVFSFSGAVLGRKLGERTGSFAEIMGGLIIIAIGLRILLGELLI